MEKLSPLKALWGFVFIVALSPVVAKASVDSMSASFFLVATSVLTVLFFTPYITKNKLWGRFLDKDVFGKMLFIGLFGTALPFLFFLIALKYTTPANSAILNQFEAVYSLILAAVLLKERPSAMQLLGTALVILGAGFVLAGGQFTIRWKGDLIIIATVWMFQLSHIVAKKLPADISADFLSCGRALFGGLCAVPLAVVLYFVFQMPFKMEFSAKAVLILLFMGVLRCALGNAMWYKAIRNMDLAKATAVALSYPVFTYLFSLLLGFDSFNIYQAAGLVCAVLGAYMVTDTIKKAKGS